MRALKPDPLDDYNRTYHLSTFEVAYKDTSSHASYGQETPSLSTAANFGFLCHLQNLGV
jgi:hypothetical protein